MKIWYSCKVKFSKETEDGFLKQVTENYLVDAISYTEAESRIYGIMEQNVHGEFSVASISKTNLSEVINYEDEEGWYKCKVTYSTVDGDKGKEVKITTYFLVSAAHVKQAFERVEDNLSSMLVPFEIPSINLTNFVDVFPMQAEEDIEPEIPDNFVRYDANLPSSNNFDRDEEEADEEEAITSGAIEESEETGEEAFDNGESVIESEDENDDFDPDEEIDLPAYEDDESDEDKG